MDEERDELGTRKLGATKAHRNKLNFDPPFLASPK